MEIDILQRRKNKVRKQSWKKFKHRKGKKKKKKDEDTQGAGERYEYLQEDGKRPLLVGEKQKTVKRSVVIFKEFKRKEQCGGLKQTKMRAE